MAAGSVLDNNNYQGSRMFTWLADFTGISVDQVNFVLSQLFALALASCFRTILHPSKTPVAARHVFGLVFGLVIGYFSFGMQAVHIAGLPALCYIIIRTQNPEVIQRMVLAVALMYLSCLHLHRQIYSYNSYALDITGPLMVITQKITSLVFSLHDGMVKQNTEMSKSRQKYAIKSIPTPLEYFSYVLHFPTVMAGPVLFYKDYIDFINGDNIKTPIGNSFNKNNKIVTMEPSPAKPVCRKVFLALLCAIVFIKFTPIFPLKYIASDHFIENTSIYYKFFYLSIVTTLVRFKYYFAWTLADAICNNAGVGFNGFDVNGEPLWNKFSNIDIVKFELATNMREAVEAWNMGTNRWLRLIVYDRVTKYQTVLTYTLSAIWHGFYPGYYLTFASGALFTFAARTVRRNVRNYCLGNSETKFMYDVLTFSTTRLVMAYITFTFVLLEFWTSLRIYVHMYMCLHLLAIFALIGVPRLFPRTIPGNTNNLAASSASIASVLKQASPLTNSVSNHHD